MRKANYLVALSAIIALCVLNFSKSENVLTLPQALASSSSNSSSSSSSSAPSASGSSSTSSKPDCCNWWGPNWRDHCFKEKVSDDVVITCKTTTTTYYGADGRASIEIIKNGIISTEADAEIKGNAVNSKVEEKSYQFHSKKVTCPPTGECNICQEYTPHCDD